MSSTVPGVTQGLCPAVLSACTYTLDSGLLHRVRRLPLALREVGRVPLRAAPERTVSGVCALTSQNMDACPCSLKAWSISHPRGFARQCCSHHARAHTTQHARCHKSFSISTVHSTVSSTHMPDNLDVQAACGWHYAPHAATKPAWTACTLLSPVLHLTADPRVRHQQPPSCCTQRRGVQFPRPPSPPARAPGRATATAAPCKTAGRHAGLGYVICMPWRACHRNVHTHSRKATCFMLKDVKREESPCFVGALFFHMQ